MSDLENIVQQEMLNVSSEEKNSIRKKISLKLKKNASNKSVNKEQSEIQLLKKNNDLKDEKMTNNKTDKKKKAITTNKLEKKVNISSNIDTDEDKVVYQKNNDISSNSTKNDSNMQLAQPIEDVKETKINCNNNLYNNERQDIDSMSVSAELLHDNNKNTNQDINSNSFLEHQQQFETQCNNNQQNNGYYYNNRNNKFWNKNRNFQNQQQEEEYVINTEKVVYVKILREKKLDELLKIAEEYDVQNLNRMLRQDIITAILKQSAVRGEGLYCDGFLEIMDDGYGFLRDMKNNYKASSYDVYVSSNQIKRIGLRQGDQIGAYIKEPRRGEKYFSIAKIETINGKKIDEIKNKINFDNLVPLYPNEKLKFNRMENQKEAISTRVIDLISPIGKGQRALIVAPPRAGKTFLMQAIAHAINENHPESELIVLLIDERPEEVTDMSRSVKGEVVSSTFDEPAKRHVELAEIVIEKAKRMVEEGKDVIILLDSITRLARAYNAVAPSSGKVLTGGVDSNALQKPKRFFGAARNIENGGSLTIIATALVETGSKMDEVIFEEFKGTGNAEIVLNRQLADKRLFPAIDILKSGTRKEEEMVVKEELQKMWILRRILITMAGQNGVNSADALEFLLDKLKKSKDNDEFFALMNSAK